MIAALLPYLRLSLVSLLYGRDTLSRALREPEDGEARALLLHLGVTGADLDAIAYDRPRRGPELARRLRHGRTPW